MCSLCTNIPQEEEIEIVYRHYEEHYQSNLPIPTSYTFGGLNATYLKRKLIQIQLKTVRTDTRHLQWAPKWRFMLSRSFFMAHCDNYYMRALTNHFSVRDLGIFPVWTLPETEINNFNHFTSSFRTTINFTLELSSKQIVLLDTEVFKGPRFIQTHFETS